MSRAAEPSTPLDDEELGDRGSRVLHVALNRRRERVRATEHAPRDPFHVLGATVELHGLVSNPAANGRHVVVVQTPPDVAARGRISVTIDGAVRAVKCENVRAMPGGVGAAPSTR